MNFTSNGRSTLCTNQPDDGGWRSEGEEKGMGSWREVEMYSLSRFDYSHKSSIWLHTSWHAWSPRRRVHQGSCSSCPSRVPEASSQQTAANGENKLINVFGIPFSTLFSIAAAASWPP